MPDAVLGWTGRILGRCDVIRDYSWPHSMSSVLRLRDRRGTEWILKQHRDGDRYQAELGAYPRWTRALGDRAPHLRANDDELGATLQTATPGEPVPWPSPAPPSPGRTRHAADLAVHRDAGEALRLLRDAQSPLPCPDLGAAKTSELARLAPQAAGLLTRRELGFAESDAAALTSAGGARLTRCHGDYTPRNWLASAGTVCIIDFEWARQTGQPAFEEASRAALGRLMAGRA